MDTIPLGRFALLAPVGAGGMGEVWRAEHRRQGVSVAVKVLHREGADLAQEARSVAALHHPHVIAVYDYGIVPREAALASGGRLISGSPYLAMEFASGGTLARFAPTSWAQVRSVLLQLLDGLAHAHARGVIHRDIKPGNIVRCTEVDARPGWKLTDFGIATTGASGDGAMSGTPSYMAPEQVLGAWREFGPWTDLYALGSLTFALVCGRAPFAGLGPEEQLRAKLQGPPPPLAPRLPVPEGLEAWVARMLHRDPLNRYRWAADAATDLLALGEAAEGSSPAPARAPVEAETLVLEALLELSTRELPLLEDPGRTAGGATEVAPREVPADWRRVDPTPPSPRLMDVGLGLYAMRTVPLVGRVSERDRIWAALREVQSSRKARAVVIRGAAGTGKSRLATWIGQRAHELGVGPSLQAVHNASTSPVDGMSAAVLRMLRCADLEGEERVDRIRAALAGTGADRDALVAVLAPAAGRSLPAGVRRAILRDFLARWAGSRILVVCIDDAQWGPESVQLVQDALREEACPILFLLTVRDDALEEDAPVHRLEVHDRVERVELSPLATEEQRELVRQLLGLRGPVASEVEARTAGNPLFAVHLVGDWVERGILEVGEDGFRLREGAAAHLPDDLYAVWRSRIEAAAPSESERASLELGATLGVDVDAGEWEAACEAAGVASGWAILEALAKRSLVSLHQKRRGWSFAHGMLAEALTRAAPEEGRLAEPHRACASGLEACGADPGRIGLHWAEAGEHERALEPLYRGLVSYPSARDLQWCRLLLERRERCVEALGLGPHSEAALTGLLASALVSMLRADFTSAEAQLHDAESALGFQDMPRVRRHIVQLRANLWASRGKPRKALRLYETLVNVYGRSEHLDNCALMRLWLGDLSGAERDARRANELQPHNFIVLRLLGQICGVRGDLDDAEAWLGRARVASRDPLHLVQCDSDEGFLAMYRGNFDAAEELFQHVIERGLCWTTTSLDHSNLALVVLRKGEVDRARRMCSAIIAQSSGQGVEVAGRILAHCRAAEGDWLGLEKNLRASQDSVERSEVIDLDQGLLAADTGRLAEAAGQLDHAITAYRVALHHLGTLGRPEAEEVARHLEACEALRDSEHQSDAP